MMMKMVGDVNISIKREAPLGYTDDATDCDDSDDIFIYVGADELCDGQDNDCDTTTDVDADVALQAVLNFNKAIPQPHLESMRLTPMVQEASTLSVICLTMAAAGHWFCT